MSTTAPRFKVGDEVRALDSDKHGNPRNNKGTVKDVSGSRVLVHFVSPDGREAKVPLHESILEPWRDPGASAPASSRRSEGPPRPSKLDIYAVSRIMAGLELNGELDSLSDTFRRMVDHLTALDVEARDPAWETMLVAREDAAAIAEALELVDPNGPPPDPEDEETYPRAANLADIRAASEGAGWHWEGYIPAGRLAGIAAREGCGKTRLALDLARRIWHGLPWPDGQPATLPPGTPTLWICADGQQDEIMEDAAAFGLPDEAILFNTPHDDPHGGSEIDSSDAVDRMEYYIKEYKPALVFVDTLTYATSRDVCRATDTKAVFSPLRDIALRTRTTIVPMMHLSKEGEALGRRSRGLTRTLLHLECPDPDHRPERLRLWVNKTSRKQAPALGVTMGCTGNEYDHNPPAKSEAPNRRPGPPAAKTDAAKDWLVDQLTPIPRRVSELRKDAAKDGIIPSESSASTLYRARDELKVDEYELEGRKWWKLPVRDGQDANSDNSGNSDSVVRDVHPL